MSRFTTVLIVQPDVDERTAKLMTPLVYESDLLGETITVPAGFETDFASVPRMFWNLIPPLGRYGEAAVVHDWLYRTQDYARATCDAVLLEAMEVCEVGWCTRMTIYGAVRAFGWAAWNSDKERLITK